MNSTLGSGFNSSTSPEDYSRQSLETARASINLALGLPINIYALWLILSGAGGTIASQLFALNLTVSGIFFSLGSVFYFAWIFTHNLIFETARSFVANCFIFSAPLFQCCICVERYLAVVHPVVFLRYKALRNRVTSCCVAWLIMIVIVSFATIFDVTSKGLIYFFLGFYIVLISVMSFCCVSVLRALKQPGPGEGQRTNGEGKDVKRKAFKIILIITTAMLVSYVPYVLSVGLQYCVSLGHVHTAVTITYTIFKMSGLVHPLLYIHRVGKLPCFEALKAG